MAFNEVFSSLAIDAVVIGFNDYQPDSQGDYSADRGNLLTMVRESIYFIMKCVKRYFFCLSVFAFQDLLEKYPV